MAHTIAVDSEVKIDRAAAEVFAVLAEVSHDPEWGRMVSCS